MEGDGRAWRQWLPFLVLAGAGLAAGVRLFCPVDREPSAVRLFHQSDHEPPGVRSTPDSDLFDDTSVHAFTMDLDSAALQSLRNSPREWTNATLRFGSEVFPNVAVHIKGSQGSLQPIDRRPSLTVSFNKFVPGRKFHGLKKIHFNNTAEDPTFMTEVISGELCRQSGLPAARSTYGTLTLNGRELGLYIVKEGLTKEFLAQYFRDTSGALYDGGFQRDITQPWGEIGGEGPVDQADRLALLAAAREPDLSRRWERLQQVLDTDRFITLLAWTTITWNWDGYPMARNNYRVYHDPETDKLVFFPHGLDQMFWQAQGTIYPPLGGLLAMAMMQIPEVRGAYRARLSTLTTSVFNPERLGRRIDELTALITPYWPEAPDQATRLKQQITERAESIADQLRMPEPKGFAPGRGRSHGNPFR